MYEQINLPYNIKKLRELRNLTIKEMAFNLEISTRAYSYIEEGKVSITVERLFRICKALNCTIDNILFFDPKVFFLKETE